MSFEEEFDKIIRQKAEEVKYPFEEGNWDKVNGLLNAERKATRMLTLKKALVPAVLIVGFSSLGLLFYNTITEPAKNTESLSVNQSTVISSQTNANLTESKTTNEISSVVNKTSSLAADKNQSEQPAIEKSETKTESLNIEKIEKQNMAPLNTSKNGIKASVVENAHIPKTSREYIDASLLKHSAIANKKTSSALNNEESIANNAEPNTSAEVPQTQASEHNVHADELLMVTMNPTGNKDKEIVESSLRPLVNFDEDYYNKRKLTKKHYLNIEAGGTYLLGWDASKTKDGKGLNYYAGFNYGLYLSRKISLSAGIQAYNIGNINKPYYEISNKEYGFGSTNVYTVVTTNSLYYLSVPLKFNYALNSSNILGLGLNAGYLLIANSNIESYYLRDNEKIPVESSKKSSSIYEGTRTGNLMLTASYAAQLNQRLALKAEFIYGVSDIFKNMGKVTNAEKPMGLRIGLQCTLFDK